MSSHILRLMFFRHDLVGLTPRSLVTVLVVVLISFWCSYLRWDIQSASMHLFILALWLIANPTIAMALALLSVGIDLVGVCTYPIFGPDTNTALTIWEAFGTVRIGYAYFRLIVPKVKNDRR